MHMEPNGRPGSVHSYGEGDERCQIQGPREEGKARISFSDAYETFWAAEDRGSDIEMRFT